MTKRIFRGCHTLYEKYTILNMTKKVVDNLARNYGMIRKEVSESMGGKVLDHEVKDILRKGFNNGYVTGRKDTLEIIA